MGINKSVSLLAGFFFLPFIMFAQFNNNTSSPYSRYGIGDLQPYSFGRTTAMGGATLGSRNKQQINMANPASYSTVDSLAFMFEFGLFGKFTEYSNDIASHNVNDINFRYFAMNFQITNWLGTSLGLTPYSDVGYNIEILENNELTGNVLNRYYGDGSLTKAYIGFGLEPVKNFSFGANINYLFGMLNRNAETYFPIGSNFYNNLKFESLRIRDFSVTLGTQATIPLKGNNSLTLGAVIEKPTYTGFYSDIRNKYISVPDPQGSSNITDSKRDTLNFQNKIAVGFPLSYGIGLSYIATNKLEVNVDYFHQQWSESNIPASGEGILTDLDRFAVGAEWIPNRSSIRSLLSRIAYRVGAKYENSYLQFGDQQISNFGITFGVGLPVYRSNSTINISAELGQKGTADHNLVQEKYALINLSMNLHDLWFIQRRID